MNKVILHTCTDSVNLSDQAISSIKETVIKNFGENYFTHRKFKNKNKGAQEAHEAVRPTNFSVDNLVVDYDQAKLYSLIWKRTISSQMSNAKLDKTIIKIKSSKHNELFHADGEVVKFDGFLKLYIESKDNVSDEDENELLPDLTEGEIIEKNKIIATQHFSKPPLDFPKLHL